MAVVGRELNRRRLSDHWFQSRRFNTFVYIAATVLALVAIYVLLAHVFTWGRVQFDNLRYGMPRTYHLTADVGHSPDGKPSHFIALNLDRQVIVLDIPGGDHAQIRTLAGPYLFGADENLTPVTLHLADVDGNQAPDLVVSVKDEEIIYMNRDGSFAPMTAEERQVLQQQTGQS